MSILGATAATPVAVGLPRASLKARCCRGDASWCVSRGSTRYSLQLKGRTPSSSSLVVGMQRGDVSRLCLPAEQQSVRLLLTSRAAAVGGAATRVALVSSRRRAAAQGLQVAMGRRHGTLRLLAMAASSAAGDGMQAAAEQSSGAAPAPTAASSSEPSLLSATISSPPPPAPSPSSLASSASSSSMLTVLAAVLASGLLGAAAAALFKTQAAAVVGAVQKKAKKPAYENGASKKRVKRAAPAALKKIAASFPNAMQEDTFMHGIADELKRFGFTRDNCIAVVSTCRDEVCRPIVNLIDREFGLSFNIAGLGGLVSSGTTGLKAAMSHGPDVQIDSDGKPRGRFIFFAFPHISIGETGEVGSILRRGRGKPSSACGALIAIKGDINRGMVTEEDPDDLEYVLLRKKVFNKVDLRNTMDLGLVDITRAALVAISDDLEKLIELTVDTETADYAVITGVQIHSGNQVPGEPFRMELICDYIAPYKMYAMVRGKKTEFECDPAETVIGYVQQ